MRTVLFIVFVIFIHIDEVLCESGFGSVFPISLTTTNDDPNFQQCPVESGAYAHTTNCSLFHMCTFGILTTYSCIDGFYFNPSSGKCQYLPVEKDIKCNEIVKHMMNIDFFPLAESFKDYNYYHRRKSADSECTHSGIYPDVLDCSLFHYCHQNKQHEIFKCPNSLHFDPKLFLCSAPQLVNCQYESPTETEDEIDITTIIESNTICHDYAPGTRLPVANKFDEFVICDSYGKSTSMKCKPRFRYNALTTECEIMISEPCEMESTLCKNNGHCVDAPTDVKGFECMCSAGYQGEYCDKPIEMMEIMKNQIDSSTVESVQVTSRLSHDNKPLTESAKTSVNIDLSQNSLFHDVNSEEKNNIIENLPTVNSPLSQLFRRLNKNSNRQQQTTAFFQMIFITIITLIGLVLLGSIILGIIICIRMITSSSQETVGTWKILTEGSKV